MDGLAYRHERIPAAVLVLCLHAAFLALLLYSFQRFVPVRRSAHETTLLLPRLVVSHPAPPVIDARGRPPARIAPPLIVPRPEIFAPRSTPSTAPPPDIQGLGRSLFGCAPQTYMNFPPEQRARCPKPGEGLAVQEAPNLMGERSHVKDEAHWEEEWAREKSPTMLPCLGGLDVLCLLGKIADGSLGDMADPRTWPHYEVQRLPPEDFKKIEDAYNAWHKAHPDHPAPAQ